jgi:Domain of unknown function (DUF5615)
VRRVLFDEDVPRQLRLDLHEFEIRTVQEEGWASVKNGELLQRASQAFAVLVTADQRLQYQQDIPRFQIGVVVIAARDTRLPSLKSVIPQLRAAIGSVGPGSVIVVKTG